MEGVEEHVVAELSRREHLSRFRTVNGSSNDQNLALTGLCVPSSLGSGRREEVGSQRRTAVKFCRHRTKSRKRSARHGGRHHAMEGVEEHVVAEPHETRRSPAHTIPNLCLNNTYQVYIQIGKPATSYLPKTRQRNFTVPSYELKLTGLWVN